MRTRTILILGGALAALSAGARAQTTDDAPGGRPDSILDLVTTEGVSLVKGQWRYSDTKIIEVDHRGPGPDLKASGAPNRTYDFTPHAGAADFDDSRWEAIEPGSLERRRSTGRLCFNWYRIKITIPDRIGSFDPTGSTVIFEVVVDDYAEVWVNGKLPQALGQAGGPLVKGWNAPNRVVVGRDVRPGQEIQLAVFGANGPLSDPPANFIWVRSATLEFHQRPLPAAALAVSGEVLKLAPELESILSLEPAPGATSATARVRIEKLASGFQFLEGPVWSAEGYLLFSDPNANRIYRWTPEGQVSVYRTRSGYAGPDIGEYHQPGSNGLAFDGQGRLTICEHGNRRVTRLEKNGVLTVLADRYQERRLNSPNDLVYRSDGALYFTDPPFGLPRFAEDPRKELAWCGVYCLVRGELLLVSKELSGPNGLAFSPDEKYLYVDNWDLKRRVVVRHLVHPEGTLSAGEVFIDLTGAPGEEAFDGLKVDREGNLYLSGPGGLWIFSSEAKHLGTIRGPELPANFAWGDADRKTLYLAARSGLYRIRTNIAGAGT